MPFQPAYSPKDNKLLFKFDPYQCTVEIVTRRYTPETGRYNFKEEISLLPFFPPDIAQEIKALLLSRADETAMLGTDEGTDSAPVTPI